MDTLNSLISYFGGWLVSVLPTSPFQDAIEEWVPPEWLGWFAWFFPVTAALRVLRLWLAAVLAYYLLQLVLRWIRAIE